MCEVDDTSKEEAGLPASRVCVCVLMNHPYPANLPLLRRVYAGRFSELLFLVPFAELDDPDVVTVYRGSYSHAAYITDARVRLSTIDCDHFLFVHDDVLLNPQFDERSFYELLALGPDDGFIASITAMPPQLGAWIWYFALLPKLLHPKSLLFGSGIEPENLLQYLPAAEAIRAGFQRSGSSFAECVTLDLPSVEEAGPEAHPAVAATSAVVLDGLAMRLDHSDPVQQSIDRDTLTALKRLTDALAGAAIRAGRAENERTIDLPIPLSASAYFTDCYILPRSGLDRFSHYMGVAGAAGLFVEIIAPTILHAVCDRVHTAASSKLDFDGFRRGRLLHEFRNPRVLAIHPFKFSMFREPDRADAFIRIVSALQGGDLLRPEMAIEAGLDAAHTDTMGEDGWHAIESWGRWSARRQATLRLVAPARQGTLRITLRGPHFTGFNIQAEGSVAIDGRSSVRFVIPYPESDAVVSLPYSVDQVGEVLTVVVNSDRLVCPRNLDPASPDLRLLGVGLIEIAFADLAILSPAPI